ncbi:MAG: NAD-dependent epimerase/dehydratase family protein [Elusimicrobiota bacterium]
MKLLVLGGSKFLGRHIVESALNRSHEVTLFNRGMTNSELFQDVERVVGDRNRDLAKLAAGKWDVVIDTCGYFPGQTAQAAQVLQNKVRRYCFISTVSVYEDFSQEYLDENSAVAQLPIDQDPDENRPETYGARKYLCEKTIEGAFRDRALIIRPGLIVGPHDPSGRFTYWVDRAARGGEILAPGDPSLQIQYIDARDLAVWIVTALENKIGGIYNAVGPAAPMTMKGLIDCCIQGVQSNGMPHWIDEEFLAQQKVLPWMELPVWVAKDSLGIHHVANERALKAGLKFRSLEETVRDTWEWFKKEHPVYPDGVGLDAQKEKHLLKEWRQAPTC